MQTVILIAKINVTRLRQLNDQTTGEMIVEKLEQSLMLNDNKTHEPRPKNQKTGTKSWTFILAGRK